MPRKIYLVNYADVWEVCFLLEEDEKTIRIANIITSVHVPSVVISKEIIKGIYEIELDARLTANE